MMSLVIEEMKHQARKPPLCWNPFGVVVGENYIQVFYGKLSYPVDDLSIQPDSMLSQALNITKENLVQAGRIIKAGDSSQRFLARRVSSKALEPDGIANENMVQGSQDRAKESAAVFRQFIGRQLSRRLIDLCVHPLIVCGEQFKMVFHVHWNSFSCRVPTLLHQVQRPL